MRLWLDEEHEISESQLYGRQPTIHVEIKQVYTDFVIFNLFSRLIVLINLIVQKQTYIQLSVHTLHTKLHSRLFISPTPPPYRGSRSMKCIHYDHA